MLKKYLFVAGAVVLIFFAGMVSGNTPKAFAACPAGQMPTVDGGCAPIPTGPGMALAGNTTAQTQTPNNFSCSIWSGSLATCIVYFVSYSISYVAGLFVALGAFLVQIALLFNQHVFDSPAVTTGFSVALAVANLGFVMAIIVIALATILRNQTYGMKQLLWKLVIMAILVNFGLVIARPIVNFSDSITFYFLRQPAIGGVNATSPDAAASGFATALTTAFAPNHLTLEPAPGQNFSNSGDTFMKAVASLVFGAVFSFVVIITLFTLAILLLVRYIALGILLIILPLAWLTYIFPGFSGQFNKWWHEFINWTFFPAAALFFIFLAFQAAGQNTATGGSTYAQNVVPAGTAANNTAGGGLASMIANSAILNQIASEVLLCGLMIGGLFAAKSLTGKVGAFAVSQAKAASGVVTGYAAQQSKKGGRYVYQKTGLNNVAGALQQGRVGNFIRKNVPIVGVPLGYVVGRGESLAGTAMGKVEKTGGSDLVEKEGKWAKDKAKDPKEAARLLAGFLPNQQRVALLKEMTAGDHMDEVQKINGEDKDAWISKNKKLFDDYGQSTFYKKDLSVNRINPQAQADAAAVARDPNATVKDEDGNVVKAIDRLNGSMKEFVSDRKRSDPSKMDLNDLFSKKSVAEPATKTRLEAYLRKVASQNSQLVPGMMSQMKGAQQKEFLSLYKKAVKDEQAAMEGWAPTTPAETEEKAESLERLGKADENLRKILSNLATYMGGGGSGGGTHVAPQPAHEEAEAAEAHS